MASIEKQLETAKKIVEQGGCSALGCSDCPSSTYNNIGGMCSQNEFFTGRTCVSKASPAHLQAFKDFISKHELPEFGERIQVRCDDDKSWEERIFLFSHKGQCYCVGINDENAFDHGCSLCAVAWDNGRKIPAPEIELTVKINGVPSKLSDISEETLKKIREQE